MFFIPLDLFFSGKVFLKQATKSCSQPATAAPSARDGPTNGPHAAVTEDTLPIGFSFSDTIHLDRICDIEILFLEDDYCLTKVL